MSRYSIKLGTCVALATLMAGCNPQPQDVKYPLGNFNAMSLAQGKQVNSECSISTWDNEGRVFCFDTWDEKLEFHKDLGDNISKAEGNYLAISKTAPPKVAHKS